MKKVGDLTLNEVADICKKCDEKKIEHCPFIDILLVDCGFNDDKDRRRYLDKEIEVDE